MMIIKNAYVFTLEQGFVKQDIVIENGYFSGRDCVPLEGEVVIDAKEDYLIPGLVDVHFHGCGGYDFSDDGAEYESCAGCGDAVWFAADGIVLYIGPPGEQSA